MASRAGSKNNRSLVVKLSSKDYFARMLTNAAEEQTWQRFLASTDEQVALKAFLRAVEYKRGKPIQPTEHTNQDGRPFEVRVLVEHVGA